ncbi:MAG: outer membrane lipoprotein-sorting protein [Deltaproteobacteria bacterium]|nr:outer membrane lipoprotein-sorting protein [Deltaproteobacteria bacterium]
MGRWRPIRGGAAGLAVGLALGAGPALGDDVGPAEDALPSDDAHLTGKDIYSRVAENRFRSYIQDISLFSSDRGGSEQETRLTITWENFREKENSDPGVLSKTMVRYTHPFEVRFTGYLMFNNLDRANDQFVYLASRRRVRRINLRGENLFGTDFSFEDVVPRELEDSTYRRLPDTIAQEVPVFVVEATPRFSEDSEYSRFIMHIEKGHYVPLENHYWDTAGVPVKHLIANRESIRQFGGVWMPTRIGMRHLLHESETRLVVDRVVPDPELSRRTFDIRALEAH